MYEFQERDSGWALSKIYGLEINVNRVNLTKGASYISTPIPLRLKNACINIKNSDVYCFKWCLVAAVGGTPKINANKTSTYKVNRARDDIHLANGKILNCEGLQFPLALHHIEKFEEQNISVNVLGYENGVIVGRFYKTNEEKEDHVNLLLLTEVCSYDSSKNILRKFSGADASIKVMDRLTPLEVKQHLKARVCHICDKQISGQNNHKVRDHCHLTGKYRGPVHNDCNLQCQIAKFIPVFFHNFSMYDSHLFIKNLADYEGTTSVIAQNKETYISMSHTLPMGEKWLLELRFLDSFRFMAASLDTLARNLEDDALLNVKEHFPNHFALMKRKGVFCYDYLSSFSKLDDDKLPPIEDFFNTLCDTPCSEDDYTHAQNVWSTMGCETLKDYMELYLITDVLLLTDVFENFRKLCMDIYKLDPCHYFTAPGLSWEAMLKCIANKVDLHLLLDEEMHKFCMRGIRGGIVQCSKSISNLPANSNVGYFLEVDLSCPKDVHDYLNDFPACPESKFPPGSKCKKLIADFEDKRKYVIHYRSLQQCIDLGLKLEKLHRIVSFVQNDWLRPYIEINNEHKAKTNIAFEKDFF
ncbi:uncharacterized protein LOC142235654 [Haematobia irritans]|uniref:uncharacterized protein LOC142235654 n=1 Tax=Haematobia irritans TaxID=7368 RepID=UPI003F50B6AE